MLCAASSFSAEMMGSLFVGLSEISFANNEEKVPSLNKISFENFF